MDDCVTLFALRAAISAAMSVFGGAVDPGVCEMSLPSAAVQ